MNTAKIPDIGKPTSQLPSANPSEYTKTVFPNFHRAAIAGAQARSPLSDAFFGEANFRSLQSQIRHRVYQLSDNKFVIDDQDPTELGMIMRGIYFEFAEHRVGELEQEVRDLNERILKQVCPSIVIAVEQYKDYVQNCAVKPDVPDYGVYPTQAGTRSQCDPDRVRFW